MDLSTGATAKRPCELVGTAHDPVIGAPCHLLVDLGAFVITELGQSLVEGAPMTKEPVEEFARRRLPGDVAHLGHHAILGEAKDFVTGDVAVEQVEGPLQHRRGGANPVMPVNLAEHHIARKDHHLGGRLALLGDGETIACLVQAQATDQAALIVIASVGNPGVKAVAHQIVELVDVDRPREHARQDPFRGRGRRSGKEVENGVWLDSPIFFETTTELTLHKEARGEFFVPWNSIEPDILNRMAERPMADVVQESRDDKELGLLSADRFSEALIVREVPEKQQPQAIDPERMLKAAVGSGRVDQGDEPELGNSREAAKLRAIDQISHSLGERHIQLRRETDHSSG